MFFWNDDRKVRVVAANLAQAMRRRYGPEAEAVCNKALARRELIGVRRHITNLALQILAGLSSESRSASGQGPLGVA